MCVVTLDLKVTTSTSQPSFRFSRATLPTASGKDAVAAANRPKRFRSTRKAKKLEAQQESALRSLESGYWEEVTVRASLL